MLQTNLLTDQINRTLILRRQDGAIRPNNPDELSNHSSNSAYIRPWPEPDHGQQDQRVENQDPIQFVNNDIMDIAEQHQHQQVDVQEPNDNNEDDQESSDDQDDQESRSEDDNESEGDH